MSEPLFVDSQYLLVCPLCFFVKISTVCLLTVCNCECTSVCACECEVSVYVPMCIPECSFMCIISVHMCLGLYVICLFVDMYR